MKQKNEQKEIDLMEYWRVVVKRKWVIITFAAAVLFFTALFTFLATPRYKSTAILQIDDEYSKMLSMEETFGFQSRIRDMRFFNTEIALLKSKSLAERVYIFR